MDALYQDLRHALRGIRRNPGFTGMAVAMLALGIGANTAIFSLADAALLRPFDVPEPGRLVAVFGRDEENPYRSLVYSDWWDLRRESSALEGPAAYRGGWNLTVTGGDPDATGGARTAAERVEGALVSHDYFSVLRVRLAAGRSFTAAEVEGGEAFVAVVSSGLARRRFGGHENAPGATLVLNGEVFTIVGVAPAGFRGLDLESAPDVWLPLSAYDRLATGFFGSFAATDYEEQRSGRRIALWHTVGRLGPEASLEAARTELTAVARRLARAYPETNSDLGVTVVPATVAATPLAERGDAVRFLGLLLGTVGLVLVLACANVANLLMARAARRRQEMGMRIALGAGPRRLVRQLLVESSLLATLGGSAGLAVALATLEGMQRFRLPGGIAVGRLPVALDGRVLLFALGVSLATGLVFGLVPALRAIRVDPMAAIRGRFRKGPRGPSGLRDSLVTVQVALCTVLLVGAGLFVRTLHEALSSPLGFEPRNVATLTLDLGPRGLEESSAEAFYDRLLERTRDLPAVRSASLTSVPVGEAGLGVGQVWVADRGATIEPGRVTLIWTSRNHFRTLGIALRSGRSFGSEDVEGAPPVAVVSKSLAGRLWPRSRDGGESDAIGRRFNFSGPGDRAFDIVGVVGDAVQEDVGEETRLQVYLPLAQHPDAAAGDPLTLHVRTGGDPLSVVGPVREVVRSLDPAVPVYDVMTLRERVAGTLWPQRMGRMLLTLFGLVALVLAGLGIYAVAAYEAGRRRRELGIRAALGAVRRDLVKLVLAREVGAVAIGLVAGLVMAAVAGRAVSGFLYGVEPTDPLAWSLAVVLLGGAAVAASLVPARRAARTDPMTVLREE